MRLGQKFIRAQHTTPGRKRKAEKGGIGRVDGSGEGHKGGSIIKIENVEQLRFGQEVLDNYHLQRVNDLFEQVERLKAIDTRGNPRLQIDVGMAIISLYEMLARFL